MQSSDGGWGAFDADNTRELVERLPFCDFGAVIDPPSADVTAHVRRDARRRGTSRRPRLSARGLAWLLAAQEPDGSWFGRWGANYVYGTGAAVPALIAAGRPSRRCPPIRRAVALARSAPERRRRLGRGPALLRRPGAWRGRGASTASQTAWALLALLAAGERSEQAQQGGDAAERGVRG